MGKYLLKLPKMGESIAEATITNWLKEVGDSVDIDESIVEIATDKVDSDVPSEFKGKLVKKNFEVNDVVKVGEVIAEIETSSKDNNEIKIVSKENQLITKGIEVGHIFYFGDKYSKPMNASVDLPGGKKDFVKMGSYGIGVSRLVGAIIEAKYDDKNEIMKWPLSVAPYDIALIPMINKNDTSAVDKANNINIELLKNNIDAIIDDTDENFSSKIKKMN